MACFSVGKPETSVVRVVGWMKAGRWSGPALRQANEPSLLACEASLMKDRQPPRSLAPAVTARQQSYNANDDLRSRTLANAFLTLTS